MINWAIILLIIGIIALALGLGGIADIALTIGWIILAIGIILFIIHAITGRKAP